MSKYNKKSAEMIVAKDVAVDAIQAEIVAEVKAEEVIAEVKAVKVAVEPIEVIEGQLGIYENRVIIVPQGARVAVVENVGGGDLFVDNTGIQLTSNYRLSPGEKKEYKGAKNLFLCSASRPNFCVRFYK